MNLTIFFLIVVGLPVICGTILIMTSMLLAAMKKKHSEDLSSEDAQILQEMHQSLIRMEKRIDSLETIYFELDRNVKGK
jgi:phage shock protein B